MKVLITGFGPFHGASFNPSGPLARTLARRRRPAFAPIARVAHVFATSYAAVDRDLPRLLRQHRPDIVLMFGVATRTPHLRIEMRARNVRSVLFADVDGHRPAERWIARTEPSSRTGRAPFRRLVAAGRAARVPTVLSRDAGRYMCNYGYWRALTLCPSGTLVQFVHIPVPRSGTSAADLARAGEAILLALMAARRR